jgi:hypothetical protein
VARAIHKNIEDLLTSLDKVLPNLASHLKEAIGRESHAFRYKPALTTDWDV